MANIKAVEFPVEGKSVTDPDMLDLIESMTGAIVLDEWRGDNVPTKTKKDAANKAQLLRRHVARRLKVEEKQVRSRVRDLSGKKDEKNGQWVWGLRLRADGDKPATDDDKGE